MNKVNRWTNLRSSGGKLGVQVGEEGSWRVECGRECSSSLASFDQHLWTEFGNWWEERTCYSKCFTFHIGNSNRDKGILCNSLKKTIFCCRPRDFGLCCGTQKALTCIVINAFVVVVVVVVVVCCRLSVQSVAYLSLMTWMHWENPLQLNQNQNRWSMIKPNSFAMGTGKPLTCVWWIQNCRLEQPTILTIYFIWLLLQ